MKSADRKLAYSAVIVFAVIAVELAWFLFVGPTYNGPNAAANEQGNHLLLGLSAEDWTAAFTGILTISTYLLWRETRRLAQGTDDQADLTREAIAAAKLSSERQLRAYIGVKSIERRQSAENPDLLEVQLEYRNYGQTPAYDVQAWLGLDVRQPSKNMIFIRPPNDMELSKEVLSPTRHAIFVLATQAPFSIEQKALLGNGWAFYVWGEVTYRDVFNVSHTSAFRFISKEPWVSRHSKSMSACTEGNYSD